MTKGMFGGGDGSTASPYLIEDALDLNSVRNNLSASYKMMSDIDLGVAPFNDGEGWQPIGNHLVEANEHSTAYFTGVFDGNGKTIKNMYINNPSAKSVGLFSAINGDVRDLSLININVKGGNGMHSGGLAGSLRAVMSSVSNGTIERCVVKGTIVSAVTQGVGLLVGYNRGTIKNCYATGSVVSSHIYSGGLIGWQDRILENSYAVVEKTNSKGGAIGNNRMHYGGSTTNVYWDKDICIESSGGEGKTSNELKIPSTFDGFQGEKLPDGSLVWVFKTNENPRLWFEKINKTLILTPDGSYKKWNSTWETITSTLPNSQQFLSDGMEISPLLDRKIQDLPSINLERKIGILPTESTAKVFSKMIDLSKYMDIRSMKVEVK